MKKILLLCLLSYTTATAQRVYLPGKDTAALRTYMPQLARQLLERIGDHPARTSLRALAGQYNESLESLEQLRVNIAKEKGLSAEDAAGYLNIFEMYNNIKMMQAAGDNRSDLALFNWAFPVVIANFKGEGLQLAVAPYQQTVTELEAEWKNEQQKLTGDSVSLDAAIRFSEAYTKQLVYKPFLEAGKKLLRVLDNNNFIIRDSVMITMRDGAKLAAVIVRSKEDTVPQPVILKANIYAGADEVQQLKEIVAHGYAAMMLNTRGKYAGIADIEPWEHDAKDIYDALDWLSKQPWCNGKVGMYGGSYVGFTQWAATKYMHPVLKTIVPQVAAAPGIDFPMYNGVYSTYMLRWIRNVTNNRLTDWTGFYDTRHWNDVFSKWYLSGAAYAQLDSIEGSTSRIFQRWIQHPSYDRYWQNMIPYQKEFTKINIPVLTIAGYFDGEQPGSLYYVKEHYKWRPSADHYVLIGPYDHGGAQGSPLPEIAGYKIDDTARLDITQLVFDWFDYTLKDKARPALLKDKINYQLMGTNTWQHRPSLAATSNDTLTFFLSDKQNGRFRELATTRHNGAVMQEVAFSRREPPKAPDSTAYSMISDSLTLTSGVYYLSAPTTEDLNITGAFTAQLSVIINKKDVDVSMELYQQQPDGTFFPLAGAMQRASYAKNRSQRILLQPGIPQTIPVTGFFTSKYIPKGSRLVIAVDVVNGRHAEVNYGTGRPVATETIEDAKEPLLIQWLGASKIRIPVEKLSR